MYTNMHILFMNVMYTCMGQEVGAKFFVISLFSLSQFICPISISSTFQFINFHKLNSQSVINNTDIMWINKVGIDQVEILYNSNKVYWNTIIVKNIRAMFAEPLRESICPASRLPIPENGDLRTAE